MKKKNKFIAFLYITRDYEADNVRKKIKIGYPNEIIMMMMMSVSPKPLHSR